MTRTPVTAVLAAGLALGLAAPAQAAPTPGPHPTPEPGVTATDLARLHGRDWTPAQTRGVLARAAALMPRSTPKADALRERLHIDPKERERQLRRAIDGSQYECGSTEVSRWIDGQMADWTAADVSFLTLTGALDWPMFEALLYQPNRPQGYGIDGRYTFQLHRTLGRLRSFWDVDGKDIRMAAMHGAVLRDDARMTRTVADVYGMSRADAAALVNTVQLFLSQPKMRGGEHPVFTFNAFAYSEEHLAPELRLGIPDKIIMGDGILQGMEGVGLERVGARAILAHEYGHQVQYELNTIPTGDLTPEQTRAVELEADAYSAYNVAHLKGEVLKGQDVRSAVRAYAELGDCMFDSTGHHGTPNQRAKAGAWGASLAEGESPRTRILSATLLKVRFRQILPEILAPDAP